MNEFKKLGVSEPILKSLKDQGIEIPTEIQRKTIPLILKGKDVIAGSATGSGKTLAFGSGIIENTDKRKGIQALVLTPTRELAEQVKDALIKFSKYSPLRTVVIYGGVSINPQIDDLRRCDVVVGTPGRILDHLQRRTIDLSKVKTLVLDEADRMLDMGFIDDVRKIISQCPTHRQTLLFSATIHSQVVSIAQRYMNHPVKVSAETYVDPKKLRQIYYNVLDNKKMALLVHLLKNEKSGLVMVFCNTRRNVDFVANNLQANGIEAQAIHGGFTQAKRTQTMRHFHSERVQVLICTDVAARGLDIPQVSHIYNYDIPPDSKDYIHRIGRTARAGKEGKVINVLSGDSHDNFSRVLHELDVKVKKENMPHVERVIIKKQERRRGGFSRGGRRGYGGTRGGQRGSRGRSSQGQRSHGGSRSSGRSGSSQRSHSNKSKRSNFSGQRRSRR
jgi:ATP-dependent RNA helicase DeaD